jgi:hypothetical protein
MEQNIAQISIAAGKARINGHPTSQEVYFIA